MFPTLFGEGYQSIKYLADLQPENILNNSCFEKFKTNQWLVLSSVGLLILIKPIATGLTVGSGGNGGNFAPSLFVGAYLGFFFASTVNKMGLGQLPIINFTIVGMAGILSGLYHAPLTAIFLIAEITGGYTLMIPLMIVSSLSFAFSKYFEPYSMDTKQLALSGKIYANDKDQNILATISTSNLIETDFQPIYQTDTLGMLVAIIAKSKRNVFPVVDAEQKLVGLVILDNIREIIFKSEMYQKTTVKDLMIPPPAVINANQSMESVMQLFDQTGAWNLPVVNNGKYIGFVSKSSIFSSYRSKLKSTTIE
jgi:CIC family chloride channel protein